MCDIVSEAASRVVTMILEKKIFSGGGNRIIKIIIEKTPGGVDESDVKYYLDVSCVYLKIGVLNLTDMNQGWVQARFAVMKDGTHELKRQTMMTYETMMTYVNIK